MTTLQEALEAGFAHHQAGRLADAERLYRQVLTLDPNQADAWHLLGLVAYQSGKNKVAIECIRQAIAVKGDEAAYCNNLGNALKAHGKADEAVACFQRAIELRSDYASAHYNLGTTLQFQGKHEEAVKCFLQLLELKPDHTEALHNLGAVHQVQGNVQEAMVCFEKVLQLQPDHAEALANLGSALHDVGRLDEAVARLRKALELKPDLAAAYINLASALHDQGALYEAIECCHRALELNQDDAEAYNNLGTFLQGEGRFREAGDCFHRALQRKPDHAIAQSNLGNVYKQLGQFDEALASYDQALKMSADCPFADFGRATLKLLLADFDGGWREYESRWRTGEVAVRSFSAPPWDGSKLTNGTLLIHAEQGLGDTLQFIRYAALAKRQSEAAKVIVECQPALTRLVVSCPAIDQLVTRGGELPPFDAHAPLLSVPGIVGTTLETIPADVPYLFADPILVDQWRQRLAQVRGVRIGINWQGRAKTRYRDISIKLFAALAELPGVRLISLQKGAERVGLIEAGIWEPGEDWDTATGAFMDTAAIMKNLDLVITSDTSIPHLAGALGVPVWVALPFVPDWRWLLDRSDSPWYPTMRLFRQKEPGDWAGVFRQIEAALRDRIDAAASE